MPGTWPLARPPALRAGDTVAVVAPSGPVDPDRLRRGVDWLESLRLRVRIGQHALDRSGHGLPFLAGDDEARAADLQTAWCDDGVRAVFAARGGSGAARLVEQLDWTAMAAAGPKLLIGCSDVTALHLALATRLRVSGLWAPVVAGALLAGADTPEPTSEAALVQALLHPDEELVLRATPPVRLGPRRTVDGPVVVVTLSILCAALGTPDEVDLSGTILVLEDIGEPPHRLERMLSHLRRSGRLDGAAGLACGDFTDCGPPAQVRAVLTDRLRDLGVPVLMGLPVGHGPVQLSLPFGLPASLDPVAGRLVVPGPSGRG